jgi:hypothetical protein
VKKKGRRGKEIGLKKKPYYVSHRSLNVVVVWNLFGFPLSILVTKCPISPN